MCVCLKLRMCPYLEIDTNRVFTDRSSQNDINKIRVGPKLSMTGALQRKREVPQRQEDSRVMVKAEVGVKPKNQKEF